MSWGAEPRVIQERFGDSRSDSDNWEKTAFYDGSSMAKANHITCKSPESYERRTNCELGLHYLRVNFGFRRSTTSFMMKTMLPTVLLVIAGLASLFIPLDKINERMSVAITTCLTQVALMVNSLNQAPVTSYVKVGKQPESNLNRNVFFFTHSYWTFG